MNDLLSPQYKAKESKITIPRIMFIRASHKLLPANLEQVETRPCRIVYSMREVKTIVEKPKWDGANIAVVML
jgi:hypothetical protein